MTNGIRQPPSNEILSQVLGLINRIAELVATGDYIFRGEPKFFDKVSSSLYRQHEVVIDEDNPIISIQDGILEEARKYTDETDDLTILSELQHFGGKTNLIDFTSDYLIALFFACDGFPLQDGRLILLDKRGSMDPHIIERHPHNTRAVFQKSVFVMPPLGYIEPDEIVKIPADLKLPLTDYLRRSHSISKETIYNDLFGFIRQQELHGEAYEELYLARKFHSEDEADFQHAVDHYTRAISL